VKDSEWAGCRKREPPWRRRSLRYPRSSRSEAVNFNISLTIYGFVAALTILMVIRIVLLPALIIAAVVLVIIAELKASNGELYRYPLTIRFIR
jgi:uncharacterized Tic20 family protein